MGTHHTTSACQMEKTVGSYSVHGTYMAWQQGVLPPKTLPLGQKHQGSEHRMPKDLRESGSQVLGI